MIIIHKLSFMLLAVATQEFLIFFNPPKITIYSLQLLKVQLSPKAFPLSFTLVKEALLHLLAQFFSFLQEYYLLILQSFLLRIFLLEVQ